MFHRNQFPLLFLILNLTLKARTSASIYPRYNPNSSIISPASSKTAIWKHDKNNNILFVKSSTNTEPLSRRKKNMKTIRIKEENDLIPFNEKGPPQEGEEPTMEEIRASLGPIGRTIAAAVEVGVITAGSYISGGVLGYTIGGVFATPTLFRPSTTNAMVTTSASKELRSRMGLWHSKASKQAGSWANLSAAFSGFHALCRVVRGKEDKWNSIIGSAATGAYLSRKAGPRAMAQGGATYAAVTYLLDRTFGSSGNMGNNHMKESAVDEEFMFNDTPLLEDDE